MARRKRLTFPDGPTAEPTQTGPLETKSYVNGWEGGMTTRAAPISQMAGDASTKAALDQLADEMRKTRDEGRMVLQVALDRIDESYLVRDRVIMDDEDMQALTASLAARGQQTPLEVTDLGEGRFGLISGWRRLTALRGLYAETSDDRFAMALCLVRVPDEAAGAYLAMVEENEIRAGISFYERARIAARATAHGAYPTIKKALNGLFGNVSRSKRSKIGSFIGVYDALDDVLRFPTALSERQGLALALALRDQPDLAQAMRQALQQADCANAAQEQEVITRLMTAGKAPKTEPDAPNRDVSEDASDGVSLRRSGARLILSGAGVDADFEAQLRDWLVSQGL